MTYTGSLWWKYI